MQGFQTFTPTGDWQKDMVQYRYIAEGHVGRYDRRIAEKQAAPPLGNPGAQLLAIHKNELAELQTHRNFWAEQHKAASNDMLLEPDGRELDAAEWSHCHQSLRANAVKYSRMIHKNAFDAYVGSAFDPSAYRPGV